MKKIEDYIHLYLGCDVMVTLNSYVTPKKAKLIGAYIDQWQNAQYHPTVQVDFGEPAQRFYYLIFQVKLILRPLSSMTEEEQDEVWYMEETNDILTMESETKVRKVAICTDRMHYLLSKRFDIFGLIESGLALDATKIR